MRKNPAALLLDLLPDLLRRARRIALRPYVANGAVAGLGLLLVTVLVHLFLGPAAAAAATVGAIVVTPADQPAPRRGKFTHFLPAVLIGTPLFLATGLLRESPVALLVLLAVATFFAFLGAAWGRRGLPVSVSVMFSMVFALAAPAPVDFDQALRETLAFALGAWCYILWGTIANSVLNRRYRVLTIADSLLAIATLMRTQGVHFTMQPEAQKRTALVGRLMKQQAALADQLQAARNILLESPSSERRKQLAGMLLQLLDMRDHLVACALDLDALRAAPGQQDLLRDLGVELTALAGDLDELALALELGRKPQAFRHARPAQAIAASRTRAPRGDELHAPPPELLAGALARRVGYVHDEVGKLVALARGETAPDVAVIRTAWELFVSPTQWTWRPFLTLWRWDAPPLRHAIRAALAITAGYAIGWALPWGSHEYWILLTIVVVLRGSLSQTLERRNSRVGGTLLGCIVAGVLLNAQLSPVVLLLLVATAQGVAHAFALQRYLVTAVAATVLALVQAHQLAPEISPVFEVAERVLDTLIGVSIAWVFSYVLPSWERTQVGALVARTLAAQEKHAQLALALARPLEGVEGHPELAWRLARREAYDSLSALVQAVQRSLSEPRAVRPPLQDLERLLAHGYQLLAQLTAIKNMLMQRRDRLDFVRLHERLEDAQRAIAAALKQGSPHSHHTQMATSATLQEPSPMLAAPDVSEYDLTPWMQRRLQLAVETAAELRDDARRALLK
ncbi:MAG: FUSC family membrane protein [Pseudomonadota bacterium]